MDAVETAEPELAEAELVEEVEELGEEERTPWYEPGLLRRIGRRRARPDRPRRRSIRERMRDRGLHWSTELVVGVFVAVLVASLATVAALRIGSGGDSSLGVPSHDSAAGAQSQPTATPRCIAAPIPGSAERPCTH